MGTIGEISEVDDREESIAWKERWPRTEPCRGGVARTEREREKEPPEIEGSRCRSQGNRIKEGAVVSKEHSKETLSFGHRKSLVAF